MTIEDAKILARVEIRKARNCAVTSDNGIYINCDLSLVKKTAEAKGLQYFQLKPELIEETKIIKPKKNK